MRQHLNNPVVVVPLALLACIWGAHSYGLLSLIGSKLFKPAESVIASGPLSSREDMVDAQSVRMMRSLRRDAWLNSNWIRESAIKNEPFVANYNFDKEALREPLPLPEEVPVTVEREGLDDYIAEHLGLDQDGFFVRFGAVWKREGDTIYTTDGRDLVLGKFAIAEEVRSETAHRIRVLEVLEGLQLQGVVSDSVSPAESDQNSPDASRREMSAVIIGGIEESGIYQLGDLVYRNPALGLATVGKDQIEIVDRYGNTHTLELE